MADQDNPKGKQKKIRHIIYGSANYPEPKTIRFLGYYIQSLLLFIESELTSNLALQKFLYFNCYYSILFFYVVLCIQIFKFWTMNVDLFNILRLIFIIVWGFLEIFRLLNGFEGNIKEQFPEVCSFLLLTLMNFGLQFVMIVFPNDIPLEFALVIISIIFYGFEMILTFIVLSGINTAKINLLGRRAPVNNEEYYIKRHLDHLKIEEEIGIKNKNKVENTNQQYDDQSQLLTQQDQEYSRFYNG